MNYSVTVLLPNGRRQKIPVKLNTPILMILEETCKKHKFNPDEYDLKYHNRILDLTSNIQFSGISNNAELEFTSVTKQRSESPVSIFLQLESGERLSGSFPPSCTLCEIISELCTEEMKSKNNPVIIYTRQEVYGDKLKSTTLKMLGLTGGKALLRLLHRTEEQLKSQSVSSIYNLQPKPKTVVEEKLGSNSQVSTKTRQPEKLPSVEKSISSSPFNESLFSENKSDAGSPMENESVNVEVPLNASLMDVEIESTAAATLQPTELSSISDDMSEIETPESKKTEFDMNDVDFIGERYALIFHADSMPSPRFVVSEEDDFYELTVEDAKTLLRDIKRTRSELEEADFETSAARAKKKSMLLERTLSIYPYCVVRIIFPSRYILQAVFESTDSLSDVIIFTKTFIDEFILSFYLYISPPKRILRAEETLLDIGAIPGINLYFGLDQTDIQGIQILKTEFLSKAVPPNVALEVANHFRRIGGNRTKPAITPQPSYSFDTVSQPKLEIPNHEKTLKKATDGKVPKWFKPS